MLENTREVLASAIDAGIPGAQTAMHELQGINAGMIELHSMKDDVIQAAIDEQEAEDIANGDIHG